MSKFLKSAAIVLCILGFIGAISVSKIAGEFSFILFISNFISIAISSAVLFAVGQILDNQEILLYNQEKILEAKEEPSEKQPASDTRSVLISSKSAKPGYWICKSCKAENPNSRKTCTECGAPK